MLTFGIIVGWIVFIAIAFLLIKKLPRKKLMPEEINKNQNESEKSWRLFGYVLILGSAGSLIFPSTINLPWIVRIILFLFGLILALVPNKKLSEIKIFNRFYRKDDHNQ